MARHRILKRLGREAAARADDAIMRAAASARQTARDINNGGRFACWCGGKGCPGTFPSLRAQKAHAAKVAARRWTSDKARKVGRQMGKARDEARRHARGWLEAAGLRDQAGRTTDRARSRPQLRGQVTRAQLRDAHRHDRSATRAENKARKAEARAARADARGRPDKASLHRSRAADAQFRHDTAWPQRPPRPQNEHRPAPAASNGNGTRPAPARTGRTR